jgi:hypothetical protein
LPLRRLLAKGLAKRLASVGSPLELNVETIESSRAPTDDAEEEEQGCW